jgi:sialidase-1
VTSSRHSAPTSSDPSSSGTGGLRRRSLIRTGALTAALAATAPAAARAAEPAHPGRGHGKGGGRGTGAEFRAQDLAEGGDGVFPNYRIPAIVQLENGDILASYDGRPTHEDAPGPNSILQRRSTDGGRTWGEQTVIDQGREGEDKIGFSDPSYVLDRSTGTLFNFHVFSKDQGFFGSVYGDDDEDRDVLSAALAVSTDDGHTWTRRLITDVVKPEEVRGTFATSGAGIQVTRGSYAGRLVQQYAGQWRDESIRAFSVYSDDHGETWHMGRSVGTDMDENKVVELSDGRLMLNSRIHSGAKARFVSISEDGGETWSEPVVDTTLTDPVNNASIIAMNPGVEAGSAAAKELLFSNSDDAGSRVNGTIRYSYDDGETWPVAKTYEPGSHVYSQLAALDDGTFAVLYETDDGNRIVYGSFDRDWLRPFRLHVAPVTAEVAAGGSVELRVDLRNDEGHALPAGTATAALPEGWTAESVHMPGLAPGKRRTLRITVTAPEGTDAGSVLADITLEAGKYSLRGDAEITVMS